MKVPACTISLQSCHILLREPSQRCNLIGLAQRCILTPSDPLDPFLIRVRFCMQALIVIMLIAFRFLNLSRYSRAFPVPRQTAKKRIRSNDHRQACFFDQGFIKTFDKAPPPATTIPLSTRSAANSGGHFSRVNLTLSMICWIGSARHSRISTELIRLVTGSPATCRARALPSPAHYLPEGRQNQWSF